MDDDQIGKKQKKRIDRETRVEYIGRINKFVEALAKGHFSGSEYRILMVLLRKTLLFNKDSDCIARSQFAESTGIAERNVSKLISKLVGWKVIIRTPKGLRTRGGWVDRYSLEEDPTKWEVNKRRKVGPREEGGINSYTSSGQEGHANEKERGIQMEEKRHPDEHERGIEVDAYKENRKEYNKLSQSKFTESLTSTDPPSCEEVGSDNVIKHGNAISDEEEGYDSIRAEIVYLIQVRIARQFDREPECFCGERDGSKIPQIADEIVQNAENIPLLFLSEVRDFLYACDYWAWEVTELDGFKKAFENHFNSYLEDKGDNDSECLEDNEEEDGENKVDIGGSR